ncbi:MAG: branched-chain amino acid ABC transporter permease [Deltaproteobacteria bacterium]|nr:branched-chain amino acid ABC transporter permease [Deltaproteobacteria bacterium]
MRPCGNYKTSFAQDEAIFQTRFVQACLLCFFVLLLLLPFVCNRYVINFANITGIFVIGAIGLNILTGFTGVISLGHGAFVGIGAYATTLLTKDLNVPFLVALPLGALITAFSGLIPGLAALRIKGMYLAIATLAVQVMFAFLIVETPRFTGGDLGLSVPVPTFLAVQSSSGQIHFYLLILGIAIALTLFARNLFRTKTGRLFVAIRDNDLASEVLGISVGKYRLLSFWIGCFYAGLAGGLWAGHSGMISPDQFSLGLSIQFLSIILVGGMGSILGSILGTVFVLLIPEVLAGLATEANRMFSMDLTEYFSSINNAIFGLLIIVFLLYEPLGLARIWWRIKMYFKLWPFSYRT